MLIVVMVLPNFEGDSTPPRETGIVVIEESGEEAAEI
jgi:hypothetical protein